MPDATAPAQRPNPPLPGPAVRPRDAATLILYRFERGQPHVLMGQRHSRHVFMPDKYVFPGGRVDAADGRIRPLAGLRPDVERRVARGCSPARARALAMAAVRETFEEAGVRLGRSGGDPPRTRSESWAAYFEAGVQPDLGVLDLIARAITPPGAPRRFDARFFMADARHVHGDAGGLAGSGELIRLRWVPVEEAKTLDLPVVTEMVIDLIDRRLSGSGKEVRIPFIRYRGAVEYLE